MISAQRYRGPNEDPFLPIYPIYPYNPKLMKRGVEKDFLSQLNPEVFAPKHTPRDSSYVNYYSGNNNRDQSTTSGYPQAYTTMSTINLPQNVNYNNNPSSLYNYPLTVLAQPQMYTTAGNYPHYHSNYQQAYYAQQSYPGKSQEKLRNESTPKDTSFIDGTNYITIVKDLKDLETQATAQIPNGSYRLLGFEGVQRPPPQSPPAPQPTAAVSGYRYQHLDQTMAQALGRLLSQQSAISTSTAPTYAPVAQNQYDPNDGYLPQSIQQSSPVIAKTGLAYVMNPMPLNIVPRHIARGQDYQDPRNQVVRPAATQVSLEPSQGIYIPPMKIKSPLRYSDYYTQANNPVLTYPPPDQPTNPAYVYPAYAGYAGMASPEMNYRLIDNNNNYYATKRNIKMS